MTPSPVSIGRSILALLTTLVGVLGVLLAGVAGLMALGAGVPADPLVLGWLLVFGLLHLLLAYTLFMGHATARTLAVLLLVSLVVVGTRGYGGAERLALGATLVFALAAIVDVAVILALYLPGSRDRP
jgi:hypothetical protein